MRGHEEYLKTQAVALGYCSQAFSLFIFYLSYVLSRLNPFGGNITKKK
jgi:hypothetical protein